MAFGAGQEHKDSSLGQHNRSYSACRSRKLLPSVGPPPTSSRPQEDLTASEVGGPTSEWPQGESQSCRARPETRVKAVLGPNACSFYGHFPRWLLLR